MCEESGRERSKETYTVTIGEKELFWKEENRQFLSRERTKGRGRDRGRK